MNALKKINTYYRSNKHDEPFQAVQQKKIHFSLGSIYQLSQVNLLAVQLPSCHHSYFKHVDICMKHDFLNNLMTS